MELESSSSSEPRLARSPPDVSVKSGQDALANQRSLRGLSILKSCTRLEQPCLAFLLFFFCFSPHALGKKPLGLSDGLDQTAKVAIVDPTSVCCQREAEASFAGTDPRAIPLSRGEATVSNLLR